MSLSTEEKDLIKKKNAVQLNWEQYYRLCLSSSEALQNVGKRNHKIRNLLKKNEMYRCWTINRNARCIMSTCNMRLQLILLNSFVFITSFVLPSGKDHFLMTDHRRKDPKFKLASRKSWLVSVLTDSVVLAAVLAHAEASGQTQAWTGRQKDLCRSLVKFSKDLLFKIQMWSSSVKANMPQNRWSKWQLYRHVEVCKHTLSTELHFDEISGWYLCYSKK